MDEPDKDDNGRKRSLFVSESQASLLGQIVGNEPHLQNGSKTIQNIANKANQRKSVLFAGSEKNATGAEETLMFDAALEIKQFGHLMAENVADEKGIP